MQPSRYSTPLSPVCRPCSSASITRLGCSSNRQINLWSSWSLEPKSRRLPLALRWPISHNIRKTKRMSSKSLESKSQSLKCPSQSWDSAVVTSQVSLSLSQVIGLMTIIKKWWQRCQRLTWHSTRRLCTHSSGKTSASVSSRRLYPRRSWATCKT